MHPRKFIRDALGFAATQYVVRVLLMLRGVIAARLLGPASYGAWNALTLIMDYGSFSPFGTQQGLDQAVPPSIVEGDPGRLDRIKRAGWFNIVVLTAIFSTACLLYFRRSTGHIFTFWGLLGIGLALVTMAGTNLSNYHLTLLRSHGDITAVSTWYLIQGSIGAVLGLSLIPWLGAWGLLVGWLTGTWTAGSFVRWRGRRVVPIVPRPASDSLMLFRLGLPIFVFLASNLVLRSIDRLVILKFLGTLDLGFYSLSVMALTLLLYLPDSIVYVLYPQLLRTVRQFGSDPGAIRDRVRRVLGVFSILVPTMCGVVYLLSREVVYHVLPKFLDGVGAMRVVCFSAGGLAVGGLSSMVLMSLGRQILLIPAALSFVVIGGSLDLLAVSSGAGITGVAWATFSTYLVYGTVLLWVALGELRFAMARRAGLMVRTLAPLALAFVLAVSIDRWLPERGVETGHVGIVRSLITVALFLPTFLLATRPLLRGLGVREVIAEFDLVARLGFRRGPHRE